MAEHASKYILLKPNFSSNRGGPMYFPLSPCPVTHILNDLEQRYEFSTLFLSSQICAITSLCNLVAVIQWKWFSSAHIIQGYSVRSLRLNVGMRPDAA